MKPNSDDKNIPELNVLYLSFPPTKILLKIAQMVTTSKRRHYNGYDLLHDALNLTWMSSTLPSRKVVKLCNK